MLIEISRVVRGVSLGVWLGGLVLLFIAAPIVFDALKPDRNKPGEIVGAILHAGLHLKLALAALALASEGLLWFRAVPPAEHGWRRHVPAILIMGAVALTLFSWLWLEPRIEAIRAQIGTFTEANLHSPERIAFGKLHGLSMGLGLLEGLFVLAALAVVLL